ncbi:hypothetical protein ACFQWA_08855 [Streptomyces thermogriseus]|uniref:hypothetical protein n=1 Tax=Streptomyces thermogriseus TaxID=75292 RepID=UPI0036187398
MTHVDDGTTPRRAGAAGRGGRLGVQGSGCGVVACLERGSPGERERPRRDRPQLWHQRLGHLGVEQPAARLDDRCEQELHPHERQAAYLPVDVGDGSVHCIEQPLVEPGRVGKGRRQGALRRRAEQREQPAAAVGCGAYEQRAQLVESAGAFAEVREGVEQLGEVGPGAERDLPVGAAGVQVGEQELVPLAGQDRRRGGLPSCDGPLHTRDTGIERLPKLGRRADDGSGGVRERPAAGKP